jgi:lysyl-tRNA synthetase class 2
MSDDAPAPDTPDREERGREADILAARRESLERLRSAGVEPFALTFEPTATAAEVRRGHGTMPPGRMEERRHGIAGRVVMARRFGKLAFLVLRDRSGDLQVVCNKAELDPAGLSLIDEIDLGDIVGAEGLVGTTKKGELSIFAEHLTLLTKALRPLPEKWHGLKDPDLQQRRRYVHLIVDELPRRYALARSASLKTIRRVLDDEGYVEFEGPMLQSIAGGAMARPFTTYHEALDMQMKLRISLELFLKRMLVGGLERVYEIGRNFRNEGIDRDHNPEFTMLEAYRAYGDYHTMMELSETLMRECARAVNEVMGRDPGSLVITYRSRTIDLEPAFERITILGSVSSATGEQISLERRDLQEVAERNGVPLDPVWGPGKVVQEMFEKLVEPHIVRPTFVCDFPREVSPLARPHRAEPGLTEHFDLVIGGLEMVTAFSELTDPDEQRARFEDQLRQRELGDEEAHPLDEDFLRALEHGMPPAGGMGMGIDRLVMLLTDAASLRDVIMFPSHRPDEG